MKNESDWEILHKQHGGDKYEPTQYRRTDRTTLSLGTSFRDRITDSTYVLQSLCREIFREIIAGLSDGTRN